MIPRSYSLSNTFALLTTFVFAPIAVASFVLAQEDKPKELPTMDVESPLLKPWTGPYGGVPPWTLVRTEEFVPAFDVAITRAQQEIDAIAANPASATFDNTILAMQNAGDDLRRLEAIFGVHASNLNVGPIPDIEKTVVPKLSQHGDSIYQNKPLFDRISKIYDSPSMKDGTFTVAQTRIVDDLYKTFIRQGARLDETQKAKLSQINTRLARLFTDFSQNVLEDEKGYVTWIDDEARLAGLPQSVVDAMASAAKERANSGGKWAVTNTRSSMDPVLTYADDRALREVVWRNYYNRGDNGDKHDNNAIISEILKLRAARAKLLGYPTHAHWRMEPTMAKEPQAAMDLMMKVWPKAVARVIEEVADMQAIADAENADLKIEPWDYRYYAEKVRKEKYDLDLNEVTPYMQLDKLREAMMWAAGRLYGLTFKQISGIPIFHPDVTVWEVSKADGSFAGLWYLDPFAREGKRSGAWMTDYREQQNVTSEIRPIVSNNSNFVKSGDGATLISWDDAVTLFHEFGHALHSLLSNVKYRSQAGTNVARDYVEFPSQVNEHWLDTPEVLNQFAVHHETGEALPQSLLDKIKKASTFNKGFDTVEYLASALIDMKLHLAGDADIDPDTFERETLAAIGMPAEIPMRHRTPQFAHIFSSDAYSAGYYSYLWSDALTADAAERFVEAGSFYDPTVAKSLYENVMSVGDTIDPAEGFRRFRGRDVDTGALLRKRGFPVDE
ncbi:Peptidyl-dipeptidase dcp [Rubripirellula tenax]|uniref:Peptidyl-dipeptidase dcp n=2 Tax=Rubripirellula tenax TaxID=2528015 RepID=A0A5C6ECC4_9BACT|nr:Peptidyl-dipeptidase dcp [Rubripirellula tenax]